MQALSTFTADSIVFGKEVVKENNAYLVHIKNTKKDSRLVFQTVRVKLVSGIDIEESNLVHLKLDKKGTHVLKSIEDAIIGAAIENKLNWFKKDLEDGFIRTNLKSYFKTNEVLTCRLNPEHTLFFDEERNIIAPDSFKAGSTVVAVLELPYVSFGKTEFGVLVKVKQMQLVTEKKKECLIDDTLIDEDETDYGNDGSYFI